MSDHEPIPFRGGPADGQLYEAPIPSGTAVLTIPIVGHGAARYLVERDHGLPVLLVYVGEEPGTMNPASDLPKEQHP